jgi:DNA-binding phage protein
MPLKPFDTTLQEKLRNPLIASEFLNSALETGNEEYIRSAINTVMEAQGVERKLLINKKEVNKLRTGLAHSHLRVKFEPTA